MIEDDWPEKIEAAQSILSYTVNGRSIRLISLFRGNHLTIGPSRLQLGGGLHHLFFGIGPAETKRESTTVEFALSRILRATLIEAKYFVV